MCLVGLNGIDSTGAGALGTVERAVTDLKFDHILALGLQGLGDSKYGEGRFYGQGLGKFAELHFLIRVSAEGGKYAFQPEVVQPDR